MYAQQNSIHAFCLNYAECMLINSLLCIVSTSALLPSSLIRMSLSILKAKKVPFEARSQAIVCTYVCVQGNGAAASVPYQGCQMAYFQTQNPNLGKFFWDLQWRKLVYFWPSGLFNGHLVYSVAICCIYVVIWYMFPRLGML
jgi:hypothetical protein